MRLRKRGSKINRKRNKWVPIVVLLLIGTAVAYFQKPDGHLPRHDSDKIIEAAFLGQRNNVQVRGQGTVIRVLTDDLRGSRHQRFLVQLKSGQTLLISHNIDLAPRIPELKVGDPVQFYGAYEYNPKGGVIHWTHHDPKGRHPGGWIKHKGVTYQ